MMRTAPLDLQCMRGASAQGTFPADSGGEFGGSELGSGPAFQTGDDDEEIGEGVVEFRIGSRERMDESPQ
jgi:hypothetical protein